jgi:hypothetical protein
VDCNTRRAANVPTQPRSVSLATATLAVLRTSPPNRAQVSLRRASRRAASIWRDVPDEALRSGIARTVAWLRVGACGRARQARVEAAHAAVIGDTCAYAKVVRRAVPGNGRGAGAGVAPGGGGRAASHAHGQRRRCGALRVGRWVRLLNPTEHTLRTPLYTAERTPRCGHGHSCRVVPTRPSQTLTRADSS